MIERRLTWKKDPRDNRDAEHKPRLVLLPEQIDHSCYLVPVRDQGRIGACVGFALSSYLGGLAIEDGCYPGQFSATYIYNGARQIEGTLDHDEGCYPRTACDFLIKHGALLEEFWPYDRTWLDTWAPNERHYAEARKWPLAHYYRVVDGIDGLCSALADGHLVAIGNPWFDSWMNAPASGLLPETYGTASGGHETLLYGYDRTRRVFLGQNSWGKEWGYRGRYEMPFSAIAEFKAQGGYDAHYLSADWPYTVTDEPLERKGIPTWLWAVLGGAALGGAIFGLKGCQ